MKTILGWTAMLDQLRAFDPHIPCPPSNRPAFHALKRNPAALTGVAAGGRLRSTESGLKLFQDGSAGRRKVRRRMPGRRVMVRIVARAIAVRAAIGVVRVVERRA